ncbi:phenylalanine 4-monooxygenase [Kitasatospora sp. NPDC056138]|uniref:phenylalanine 4-monooxygenase n=1 Tax=Kitasatospora sp. NPDC056138 TaxID=3345724 RepID=UPI0035DDBC44
MKQSWERTPLTCDGLLGPAALHPGLSDPRYLERRRAVAALVRDHRVGDPAPPVAYTEPEHATWRTVHRSLATALHAHACRPVLEAREQAPIPTDHIPQHSEVGARLRRLTGFDFTPTGGVVPNKRFLGSMDRGYFHAVQFVRHPALPLYTPEPDVIHDVFGHGIHLASPELAELYRVIGRAAMRVDSSAALRVISHVYWFTLECGVIDEHGTPKAFGAALLSSSGELARLDRSRIHPLDLPTVLTTRYEISGYQPNLFCARSLRHLADTLSEFFDDFDDETVRSRGLRVPAP